MGPLMSNVHFISGLPRCGSTLLGAILRQNPRFHAGMSSPVFSLLNSLLPRLSNANEFGVMFSDSDRINILRGLFDSYYQEKRGEIIFDTNRSWTQKLPVLLELFPDTRLICCVRPINEIMQSFERQYLDSPLQLSQIVGYDPDTSVYVRTDRLMMANGLVGLALNGLKEAFYGHNSDHLMVISYSKLVSDPAAVLEHVYQFVGEPMHAHDFDNVAFAEKAFDTLLGAPGLHDVRQKVAEVPSKVILPPDVVARYAGIPFWESDTEFTRANTEMV